ncbi:hypothetical protein GCM10010121_012610 [Streptomyces brasiliensis]|uniref:Uncharacterized protein n=1 Tax=Streptomyces brasiliensis TaxID=1954 RepID=A0A917K8F1_9ACTN|nr:hypothetical protein GCM10010121_012610 [Streptomyces brasiliensis]
MCSVRLRARVVSHALTTQAEDLRAVLGTDAAPGRQAYARTVARLDAAEDLLTRAHHADQRADGVDAQIRGMYDTNHQELQVERRIRERAALKRMLPWRKGMLADADALRDRTTQRAEQIGALRSQALDLRNQADQMHRQAQEQVNAAGGSGSYRLLGKQIAEQRALLPQRIERLDQVDHETPEPRQPSRPTSPSRPPVGGTRRRLSPGRGRVRCGV